MEEKRILFRIEEIINTEGIGYFIIERPEYYGGRGAIAHSSGRIGALYRMEGILMGICMRYGTVWEITPIQWKGNLPKEKTTSIINQIFGLKLKSVGKDSDIADAIALGSRVLGYW